jgi:hypothetical protein
LKLRAQSKHKKQSRLAKLALWIAGHGLALWVAASAATSKLL